MVDRLRFAVLGGLSSAIVHVLTPASGIRTQAVFKSVVSGSACLVYSAIGSAVLARFGLSTYCVDPPGGGLVELRIPSKQVITR